MRDPVRLGLRRPAPRRPAHTQLFCTGGAGAGLAGQVAQRLGQRDSGGEHVVRALAVAAGLQPRRQRRQHLRARHSVSNHQAQAPR